MTGGDGGGDDDDDDYAEDGDDSDDTQKGKLRYTSYPRIHNVTHNPELRVGGSFLRPSQRSPGPRLQKRFDGCFQFTGGYRSEKPPRGVVTQEGDEDHRHLLRLLCRHEERKEKREANKV